MPPLEKYMNMGIKTVKLQSNWFATDEDFTIALQLAEIYLQHSNLMLNNLPNQSEATHFKTGASKRKFFDALPQEFTRQQAVETDKLFTLAARTVDDIPHNATGKAL